MLFNALGNGKLSFTAALASVALLMSPAQAQTHAPKILTDPDLKQEVFLPDFSYAGYGFGLAEIPAAKGRVFDVVKYGAVADDGLDDTNAIQKALEAAHEHDGPAIIQFPQGRMIITEILHINRSDIVLRGHGRSKTGSTLYFPRPLNMVGENSRFDEIRTYLKKYNKRQREPKNNLNVMFSEYSWTGGFIWVGQKDGRPAAYLEEFDVVPPVISNVVSGVRGEREVTVDNAEQLTPGQRIQVLWYNRKGPDGPLINEIYGDTDLKIGAHHWNYAKRALVKQRTIVSSIEGDKVVLGDPLLHNINSDVPAEIAAWDPLTHVGIEDLRIEFPNAPYFGHHVEQGYNGVYLTGAADSWVRNVNIINADSGILTYDSANLTIRDIRTEGDRKAHYAVHLGNVHNVLAERVQTFNVVHHSLTFNTQSTRSVYKDAEVFVAPALDQHAGANHQNLFDNVTLHVEANRKKKRPVYAVFDGSGAPYWQPGHGMFNTTWNLKVLVESGADADETVILEGRAEGPKARIIGISGNRNFELDYRPAPYISNLNEEITAIPSLYDYQRSLRIAKEGQ